MQNLQWHLKKTKTLKVTRAKVCSLQTKKKKKEKKTPWRCAAEASESLRLPQHKRRNTCLYGPLIAPYSRDSEKSLCERRMFKYCNMKATVLSRSLYGHGVTCVCKHWGCDYGVIRCHTDKSYGVSLVKSTVQSTLLLMWPVCTTLVYI